MNKKEAKTYIKIADLMGEEAKNIVFLTDDINGKSFNADLMFVFDLKLINFLIEWL